MDIISGLNEKQKEALLKTDGAVLVIAGAGSGKTKVLTHKIAYLVEEKNIKPWNILAITFTNKAAREMEERVAGLIGTKAKDVWLGTFHAICLRILRKYIDRLGYTNSFSIYDVSEQKTAIKRILKDLDIDTKIINEKYIQAAISNAKNDMITPENMEVSESNYNQRIIAKVYGIYQKRLKSNNAVDFDDIINLTIKLLEENEDIKEYYSDRFQYVLVDEYQDTNKVQFNLIKILSSKHKNITVVGDNDQGIYSFRGANIQNILDFEKDFKDAEVIKLEQNYRSTRKILDVANSIIKNNESKYDKNLWTNSETGKDVVVRKLNSQYFEADFVEQTIKDLIENEGYSYKDIAVLYRMNSLSRVIEDKFVQAGTPYKMVGGQKFYDRKEIKDVISYLRLVENQADNVAFMRVINEPKRGIGDATISKVSKISMETGLSMYEITKNADQFGLNALFAKSREFVSMIDRYAEDKFELKLSEVMKGIVEESNYLTRLKEESKKDDVALNRIENIEELYNAILEYEKTNLDSDLTGYLESIAITSDVDNLEDEDNKVTLMTLHSSKGLEYKVVFLIGLEEGIFPSSKSLYEQDGVEEERRLCYVGVTRAKERLYITCAANRSVYGKSTATVVSRFIEEIPEDKADIDLNITYVETHDNYKRNYYPEREFKTKTDTKTDFEFLSAEKFLENLKKNNTQNGGMHKEYKVGQRVMHKKFGEGLITSVEPEDDDYILDISFNDVGNKRVMANFNKMDILED